MDDPIPALKQQLGAEIARLMRDISTSTLGMYLQIDQPRISELRRQKLTRFSLTSLIRYLHRLECDVQLTAVARRSFRKARVPRVP